MTPQENLVQRRADFYRAVDMILDHLHSANLEELISFCKDPKDRGPSIRSVEMQDAAIDAMIRNATSDVQALVIVRRLLISRLNFPALRYARALQEAATAVSPELGEAYLVEATELIPSTCIFMNMINNYLMRRAQGQGNEDT